MKRENEATSKLKYLAAVIIIFGFVFLSLQINDINNRLEQVPKRICKTTEYIEKFTVPGITTVNGKYSNWTFMGESYVPEEAICEDGLFRWYSLAENKYETPKTCLLKRTNTTCEVI